MPTRIAVSSKTTPSASVKSAARVLSIFEYFDRMRSPRTLSEISQDLDYPVSSTLALLRSVQGMGYLNYNHDRKSYSPSVRFALLGKWIHDSIFEGATVQIMEQLAAVTKETVLLSIQNGFQSQHVRIIETAQPLRYHPLVGTLRPLLRSAVGRVLLAQQPKAAVLKIIERINTLQADGGRVFKPQDVLDDLTAVRKLGYAFSSNLFEPGAAIVAVALPWRAGEVQMAVSVGGPARP
jgi:DNA-binding IclR family transcriptional regulator